MITSLTPAEQDEMKQKLQAMEIFKGAKPWLCSARYRADYLQMPSNLAQEKYIQGMQRLFATYGDTQVLFADCMNKVNRKGKSQKRAIIVTEKNIYKQEPGNYKVRKGELPLSQINSISMSRQRDTWVILHANGPYRDMVLDLGLDGIERYSEFVTVIYMQVKRLTETTIKVNFTEPITYNNSRTSKSPGQDGVLSFQACSDPKLNPSGSTFKPGKNNQSQILFK